MLLYVQWFKRFPSCSSTLTFDGTIRILWRQFRKSLQYVLLFTILCIQSRADQYLFLVGVEDYSQVGELRDLKFAEDDVHRLAELFIKAGVPRDHVVLMTKRAATSAARFFPTSELIIKELKLLLAQLEPEDSIIVGLSGHGLQFSGDNTNYFCPINANPDPGQKGTLISLPDIYSLLSDSKAGTKLLLVDACRNDPLSPNGKAVRKIPIQPVFARPAPVFNGGSVAIFSCSESQQSFEHEEIESGVFFHFVNRALSGEADADDDAVVDLAELWLFTVKNVQNWSRSKLGKEQKPDKLGREQGAPALIRLSAKKPFNKPKGMKEQVGQAVAVRNEIGMEFAQIPAGTFVMGSPTDEPGRFNDELEHVKIIDRTFFMGLTEVTQGQYRTVTKSTNPSLYRQPQHPVENVNWDDAVLFCKLLSDLPEEKSSHRTYRLPTEAEWEYACRAGTQSAYYFGDDPKELPEYGWFRDNTKGAGASTTFAVRQKIPNAWGLYDMHGNVWEWCDDFFEPYPSTSLNNQQKLKLSGERVLRGGSYQDAGKYLRSATRSSFGASTKQPSVGFRVVMEMR